MKRFKTLFLTALCFCAFINKANAQVQNLDISITNADNVTASSPPADVRFVGKQIPIEIIDYQDGDFSSTIQFALSPYNDNGPIIANPVTVRIGINVYSPVNIKYSMYTYKSTYSQSGKRGYEQGCAECTAGPYDPPLSTMDDVNTKLDKIYEFPVQYETATGIREFNWDGRTDPQFTGQVYPINDCVYVVATNADTGELLGLGYTSFATYCTDSYPGAVWTAGEKTVSGKIYVGYDDERPIRITAALMRGACGWGALSYDVVNQGAEAMLADIHRRMPGDSGDVLAYKELTNPTVDSNNPYVKIFEWNDVKAYGTDKPFIQGASCALSFIIETDNMTFTGVKDGYIDYGNNTVVPVPTNPDPQDGITNTRVQNFTLYPNPVKDELQITNYGLEIENYSIVNMVGQALMQGKLQGETTIINVSSLPNGVYFIKAGNNTGKFVKN